MPSRVSSRTINTRPAQHIDLLIACQGGNFPFLGRSNSSHCKPRKEEKRDEALDDVLINTPVYVYFSHRIALFRQSGLGGTNRLCVLDNMVTTTRPEQLPRHLVKLSLRTGSMLLKSPTEAADAPCRHIGSEVAGEKDMRIPKIQP